MNTLHYDNYHDYHDILSTSPCSHINQPHPHIHLATNHPSSANNGLNTFPIPLYYYDYGKQNNEHNLNNDGYFDEQYNSDDNNSNEQFNNKYNTNTHTP